MNGPTRQLAGAMALVAGVVACRGEDAALAPPSPAFAAVGNQTERLHFVANGDNAYAGGGTTDESGGMVYFGLYAWRIGSRADPGAFVSYEVWRCDASLDCTRQEFGEGEIPSADLTGSAAGGLHLETNTATNPKVVKDGPGGLIVLDWKKTGDWLAIYTGTRVHRSPGYTWRRQGTETSQPAVASGEVLGIPAGGGAAQLGTTHEAELEIIRETGRLPILDAGLTSPPDAAASVPSRSAGGPAGPAVVLEDGSPEHSVANGDEGSVEWSVADESGRSAGSVWVRRGARTELSYDIVRCDPSDRCTRAHGYGDIPEGDITGSAPGGLHLRTNTAGLPGFYNSGPGGVIEVDWKRTALWLESDRGSATWQRPTYTERRRGESTDVSAIASGQILGVPIPPAADAQVGTSHSVRILIEKEP